jgi:hypothetical protein
LNTEFTLDEIKRTVDGMAPNAAVGAFGIDIAAIKLLLDSTIFGPMI